MGFLFVLVLFLCLEWSFCACFVGGDDVGWVGVQAFLYFLLSLCYYQFYLGKKFRTSNST